MILQVNTTGAWRNVVTFDAVHKPKVAYAVGILAATAPHAKWCILGDDGKRDWLTPALKEKP